ncbi:hypothetical protein EDB89DRAFT_1915230 [Lactarius sanguifluus]|nr:hypothetical protein EDB89DRAFT_1915230 [Lactarius sanguifluus]
MLAVVVSVVVVVVEVVVIFVIVVVAIVVVAIAAIFVIVVVAAIFVIVVVTAIFVIVIFIVVIVGLLAGSCRQAWEATFPAISNVCIVKPCCQQQQQQRPTSHVDFASYNYDTSSGDDATTTTRDGVCRQRATQHIDHLDGIRRGDVNHSKNNNDSNIINDSDA